MSGVITLKITSLLIRTISKPIANAIKSRSRESPFLKRNFIRFGQFINTIDLKLRNNSNIKVRPLNDNKAIELGSNFLSELFVFSTAAGLILYELLKPKKVEKIEVPVEVCSDHDQNNDQLQPNIKKDAQTTTQNGAKPKPQSIQELKITPELKEKLEKNIKESLHLSDLTSTVDQLTSELKALKTQNSAILEELNKLKAVNPPVNKLVNKQ